jgi:hypothetical protein
MQESTVTALAEGIGTVVHSKGYDRITAGKHTLAYANTRKAGVLLDFRATDLDGAPAPLRKRATIKGNRAVLLVDAKTMEAARALLTHVKEGRA